MKQCLIVVDYQNDFIDGALGFDEALQIEAAIVDKIKAYRLLNADILFTQDTHDEDYLETEEGKHLSIVHCLKGTYGHEIKSSIKKLMDKDDKIFIKHTFPSLELGQYLKEIGYDIIELVGLVSNICVLSNAVIAKAACPNARIIVDASCTASFDSDLHQKALDIMEGIHINIKNRG
ncbi:MAG: cysteine hydrolase family protein [Candidatus Izemoplasmataceae bacterium]|uniref:cysteine hydrolase family protein n=1 Tax=Liberiplasma polymorphum TaxID=3374570 RepID=UPI003775386C